jgi:hypothetical protein
MAVTVFSFTPNVTVDIYHSGGGSVLGIQGMLQADYLRREEAGKGESGAFRWTHTLLLPQGTDIRDAYDAGTQPGGQDTVWLPHNSASGTPFRVQFVETKAWNTPWAYLKVYLDRGTPPWPTRQL